MPSDFFSRPLVARLPLGVRATYAACWLIGMNAEPLGYLVDEHAEAISARGVGRVLCIPETTAIDHVAHLIRSDHLNHEAFHLYVTELYVTELVRSEGGQRTTPPHNAPLRGGAVDNQLILWGKDVNNQDTRAGPLTEIRSLTDRNPVTPVSNALGLGFDLDFDLASRSSEKDVEGPSFEKAGENPFNFGLSIDLAPPELTDPDARHLVGKLATACEAWRLSARDAADLAGLLAARRADVIELLRQQSLTPTARNPLAWIRGSLKELEAAS